MSFLGKRSFPRVLLSNPKETYLSPWCSKIVGKQYTQRNLGHSSSARWMVDMTTDQNKANLERVSIHPVGQVGDWDTDRIQLVLQLRIEVLSALRHMILKLQFFLNINQISNYSLENRDLLYYKRLNFQLFSSNRSKPLDQYPMSLANPALFIFFPSLSSTPTLASCLLPHHRPLPLPWAC